MKVANVDTFLWPKLLYGIDELRNQYNSAHYYAFGGGPRICIGMRFALLEEKMALVRLLGRYSLAKTEQTEKLLKVNSQVVLNPGAVMRFCAQADSNRMRPLRPYQMHPAECDLSYSINGQSPAHRLESDARRHADTTATAHFVLLNAQNFSLTHKLSKPRIVQVTFCPSHELSKPRIVQKKQQTLNEAELSTVTFERGKTNYGGDCLWLNGFILHTSQEIAEKGRVKVTENQRKCWSRAFVRREDRICEAVRNTFRRVFSLPLFPSAILEELSQLSWPSSPPGMPVFFLYFSRTYIGLTQRQLLDGVNAFGDNPLDFSPIGNHSALGTIIRCWG
ncbi:hypothetical protein niasHS_013634 [Heterodera schachtii]|uniref:Cytochrome P450 n=1 Tax=Heterodera schachtii TaxID=97005 RepID=A0ABD2INV1_HETSC